MEPAVPIEPAAPMEPAAPIEPAAPVEPAGPEFGSGLSVARRFTGTDPSGTDLIPTGTDCSSEVIVRALTVVSETVTWTCCWARSLPSTSACTV